MPPIRPELLDELLKDYQKPEDLLGQDGLLQQLKARFSQSHNNRCVQIVLHKKSGGPTRC